MVRRMVSANVIIRAERAGEVGVRLLHSGKVRDIYVVPPTEGPGDGTSGTEGAGDLLLVATDRISVYDTVLPTPIPDKGRILTQLSLWWFDQLTDLCPNHVISATDVPAEFAGRAIRCRRLAMLPIECVARGYLAGLGLREYREHGSVSGVPLPPGLVEGSRLPEPIFTPTTKAPPGEHDELITAADVAAKVGAETANELRRLTLEIYRRGAARAAERGILIADTKLEFGRAPDGSLVLADEVLTPDSSRFWPADSWQPGRPQHAFDKQFVRDWADSTGWDHASPAPAIPPEVVETARARYVEAYERLTGDRWIAPSV
jgi:phosphoribosylaminoimidazole-succinocarboxamide synthase